MERKIFFILIKFLSKILSLRIPRIIGDSFNIVDEYTADPISCDVIVDLKNANGELKQVVNDGHLPVDDFGVGVAGPMRCINNLPFLVETETGMTSLKISKAGYITKTAELNIPAGESCGLIPTDIEVKLEPVN